MLSDVEVDELPSEAELRLGAIDRAAIHLSTPPLRSPIEEDSLEPPLEPTDPAVTSTATHRGLYLAVAVAAFAVAVVAVVAAALAFT